MLLQSGLLGPSLEVWLSRLFWDIGSLFTELVEEEGNRYSDGDEADDELADPDDNRAARLSCHSGVGTTERPRSDIPSAATPSVQGSLPSAEETFSRDTLDCLRERDVSRVGETSLLRRTDAKKSSFVAPVRLLRPEGPYRRYRVSWLVVFLHKS